MILKNVVCVRASDRREFNRHKNMNLFVISTHMRPAVQSGSMSYHTIAYYNINCIQCMLQYCIMSRTQRTVHSELCNVCFVVCHRGSSVVYMHIIIGHNEYRKKKTAELKKKRQRQMPFIYIFSFVFLAETTWTMFANTSAW